MAAVRGDRRHVKGWEKGQRISLWNRLITNGPTRPQEPWYHGEECAQHAGLQSAIKNSNQTIRAAMSRASWIPGVRVKGEAGAEPGTSKSFLTINPPDAEISNRHQTNCGRQGRVKIDPRPDVRMKRWSGSLPSRRPFRTFLRLHAMRLQARTRGIPQVVVRRCHRDRCVPSPLNCSMGGG
jgi:hypothetical protein